MNMMAPNTDLAFYKSLAEWAPRIGDNIVWHGWLQHWFGVVNGISPDGNVSIIRAGIPLLLFSMSEPQMEKNTVHIHITELKTSTGGKYCAMQAQGGSIVWYV